MEATTTGVGSLVQKNIIRESVITLLVFFLLRFVVRRLAPVFKSRLTSNSSLPLPPAPPGLPIVGNLLSFRTDMRATLRRWTEEFGGIFMLRLGPQMKIVVLSDVEVMHEAFIEKAANFSGRTIPPLLTMALGTKGSLVFETGSRWKKARTFGHQALRSFGAGKTSMENRIIEEIEVLIETCQKSAGRPTNPRFILTNVVANVISNITFGRRYDYDDATFQQYIRDVDLAITSFSMTSAGNVFPWLYYTPVYADFRRPANAVIGMVKGIVCEEHESFQPSADIRHVIDFYRQKLAELRMRGEHDDLIEAELEWRGIVDLFVAGLATTSDTLYWALLLLAVHPDVMKEVQKEIDEVVDCGRTPRMSDQESLPLMTATIMETMRYRPAVPLGLPRCTDKDSSLAGYRIPRNTTVIMNLLELHHSKKYWNEPEKFNPRRFLSDDGKTIKNNPAYMPFGMGLRLCLGDRVAKMQLFLVLTSLLQKFSFRIAEGSRGASLEGIAGMTLGAHDYEIVIEERC